MNLTIALGIQDQSPRPHVVTFTGAGGKTTTLFRLANELVAQGRRVITTSTTQMPASKLALVPAHVTVANDQIPFDELSRALDVHGQCLLVGPLAETVRGHKATAVAADLVDQLAEQAAAMGLSALLVEGDGARTRSIKAPAAHEPVVPTTTTLLVPMLGLDAIGRKLDETYVHRPQLVRRILGLSATDEEIRLTPDLAAHVLVHPDGGAKGRPPSARLLPLLNKADTPMSLVTGRLVAQQLLALGQASLLGAVGCADDMPVRERWASICAVVIAAGASRRMGRPKQLEPADGEAMGVRAVRVALESGAQQVIVVTGAYAEQVAALLQPQIEQEKARLQLVHNRDWATGQASSVQTALRAVPPHAGAVVILPVDQPFLASTLLRRLCQLWRRGARIAAPMVDQQVRGAPALFDATLWGELRALEGDVGARPLLQKHKEEVKAVTVSASMLRDIDSPADLSTL